MTWEDILKQKKEYRVYFEFYMNSGQRAPSFDVDIKFTGTAATGSDGQAVNLVLKRRNFPGEELTTAVTSTCTSNTTKIDTRASSGYDVCNKR